MNCQKCFVQSVLFTVWSFVNNRKARLHNLGQGVAQCEYSQVLETTKSRVLSTAPLCLGGCKHFIMFCICFFSLFPASISLLCIKYSDMHWRESGDTALRAVTPEHQGTVCSPVVPSNRFFHHLALLVGAHKYC